MRGCSSVRACRLMFLRVHAHERSDLWKKSCFGAAASSSCSVWDGSLALLSAPNQRSSVPSCLPDKIEEAQKELKEPKGSQKGE